MAILTQRVSQRTLLNYGRTRNIVESMAKTGYSFDEMVEASVFACTTGHFEQKFRIEMKPEFKGKLLESLCTAFPPTAEQKEEIIVLSGIIKADLQHLASSDANPKELLKETQRMRDAADLIAQATKVPSDTIVSYLRQAEGEEDTAKACVIAKLTGKDLKDIVMTKRSGDAFDGWLKVYTAYDLIESTEQIGEKTFAIATAIEKKLNPAPKE